MEKGKIVLGVLGGIAVGALIGVLFAPDKGSVTRRKISKKGEEYLDDIAGAGDGAFAAGLLFPAIPIVVSNGIGIDIVKSYIDQLN